MIVDNFDAVRAGLRPNEADPPLVIDANAVLSCSVRLQGLQPVSGRRSQGYQRRRRVQHVQLASQQLRQDAPLSRADARIAEKNVRFCTSAKPTIILSYIWYVARSVKPWSFPLGALSMGNRVRCRMRTRKKGIVCGPKRNRRRSRSAWGQAAPGRLGGPPRAP